MNKEERKTLYDAERNTNPVLGINIETRVPSKWRFVDLETGDVWMWTGEKFTRAGEAFPDSWKWWEEAGDIK